MEEINTLVQTNFQKNINYIQTNHKELFKKLSALDNAVENNHYEEKYQLAFENGAFDILIRETQTHLYEKNPKKFIQLLLNSVTLKKEENSFIAFKSNDIWLDIILQEDMKTLEKFIFFGVGSGEHIWELYKKSPASNYLIIEDDLELFRLSLMTTPYYKMAKSTKISFSIFEDSNEFEQNANSFLEYDFHLNHYIKFLQLPYVNDTKVDKFHLKVTTQSHLNFSYKSILSQYTIPLKRILKGYNFLNLQDEQKYPSLEHVPFFLLAPGPSLNKHIKWLKQHYHNYYIVALSATLPILQEHNIIPDMITHTDGFQRSVAHFEKLHNPKEYLKNTIALISARAPQDILDIFNNKNLFLFENGTNYKKDFGSFSAFCSGSSTYLILLVLKVKELYLLGLDLALDAKTQKTHSDGYIYTQEAHTAKDTFTFRDTVVLKEGNFTREVKTTPNFILSINAINEITKALKESNTKVYNLNDGVKFQGIDAFRIENIKNNPLIYDKKNIQAKALNGFIKHSEQKLSKKETQSIKNSLSLSDKYKTMIKEFDLKVDSTEFSQQLLDLSSLLTKKSEEENLSLIFKHYFYTTLPYIFNILNSSLQNTIQIKIKTKLVQELLRIIQTYQMDINEKYK